MKLIYYVFFDCEDNFFLFVILSYDLFLNEFFFLVIIQIGLYVRNIMLSIEFIIEKYNDVLI